MVEHEKPDEVYLVESRKYGLDATAPRWRHVFFRWVYLPFNRFSFKWVNIPALGSHDEAVKCSVCGTQTKARFSWVEPIIVATNESAANQTCKDEFDAVYPMPLDGELPRTSLQYKGHRYPKAKSPGRYIRRVFRLTAVRRKDLAMLEDVNARADKLLHAARAG